ncbi:hypothetical protein Glove_231g8 [Diversispora epigaea]|uniref:Uncharacterized protein n=1 Tax=Diversispora epigaea TaxID=1348612 RepID=A0A397IJK9_9GLOM|nr:hypothetical protein Glove_231g8 [Diversispora epigaea]
MPRKRKNTRLLQVYNDKRRRLVQKNNKKGEENVQEGQISEDTNFDSQEEENEENESDEKEEEEKIRVPKITYYRKFDASGTLINAAKETHKITSFFRSTVGFSDNLATGSLNTYSVSLVPSTHLEFSTEQDEDETISIALYENVQEGQISEDTNFDSQEEENEENESDEKEEEEKIRVPKITYYRKFDASGTLINAAKETHKITSFFRSTVGFSDNLATGSLNTYSVSLVPSTHLEFSTEQDEDETISIALYEEDLLKNRQVFTAIEYNERQAVYEYFIRLSDSCGKINASQEAANMVYISPKPHKSKKICILAKFYMHHKSFPLDNRGYFQKHKRFIDNEDIALKCLGETKKSISLRMARKWLKILRCKFEEYRKGIYLDGHERKDVVTYRNKFLQEIKDLE